MPNAENTPELTEAGLPATSETAPLDPATTGSPVAAPEALPGVAPASETSSAPTTPTAVAPAELPVEYADPSTAYQEPIVSGGDDDLLYGPPSPEEQRFPGGGPSDVPAQARNWLPALQTAAEAPGAPAEFQNLLKLVVANIQARATQE